MNMIYLSVEKTRKDMIDTALKNGLTCPKSIKLSQHLDKLLNLLNECNISVDEYNEL
ncbi:aspartyl-phosphate phosphatase Spo0E family protein [Bacillus sp. CGMCC 1.16541]|uniref:aspartyl-phosphate phosphatase Spo0E family protein n=1 Tax=Bacillus sp. CGMCC 1.16541 TaxID=2185143 RepID=UPI000D735606|nr:aspartyl-phosphate phosphatase Spo0E family protein [Bacillus sp. CGMCC 1.16541]